MNELQRQAYLQALGFTPWVARRALPGAAPSTLLSQPAPAQEPQAAAAGQPVQAAAPQPVAAPVAVARNQPAEKPQAEPAAVDEPVLCMHACPLGDVLLLVEQQPADAPDLGREARELLDNLVRALRRTEQRRRRFDWPMAHDIGGTLEDFLVQFCRSLNPARVLLVVAEDTSQRLLGAPRYQSVDKHGFGWLAISSLQEMLAQPVAHKRASWEAIKQAGLQQPPVA